MEHFELEESNRADIEFEGLVGLCSMNQAQTATEDPIIMGAVENLLNGHPSRHRANKEYFVQMLQEQGYVSRDATVSAAAAVAATFEACRSRIYSD
jgi:hypothetical protein